MSYSIDTKISVLKKNIASMKKKHKARQATGYYEKLKDGESVLLYMERDIGLYQSILETLTQLKGIVQ